MPLVKEYMTSSVITVQPNALIEDALDKMLEAGISGLPVVDSDDCLVGVISEFDALLLLDPDCGQHDPVSFVALFMTSEVRTIGEDADILEAATIMREHSVRRLPVVNGDKLVGIITRRDMARIIRQQRKELSALPWDVQSELTKVEHHS